MDLKGEFLMGSVRYTAVVLDAPSVAAVREHFRDFMRIKLTPMGFAYQTAQGEPLPHHMTMNMGPARFPVLVSP